jgi:hypothetical protein
MGDSRRVVIAHDDITQIKQYSWLQKSEGLYRRRQHSDGDRLPLLPDTL